MERFKKRTIALVLASVVTVVGAFGADNYKNSLTGLSFEGSSAESLNLVVKTKNAVEGSITPMRKDAYTYVITLPETNSLTSAPDLKSVSSDIASVNIRTMPYSNTAKGYTRITIKTHKTSTNLSASNVVYVGTSHQENYRLEDNLQKERELEWQKEQQRIAMLERRAAARRAEEARAQAEMNSAVESGATEEPVEVAVDTGAAETPVVQEVPVQQESNSSNNTYIWLWALLIVLGSFFFFTKAKNKMQEIAGESLNIDVNDEKNSTKKSKKIDKIKKTINTLDSAYSKTSAMPGRSEYTVAPTTPVKTAKPAEELDIVDLDELFQEHKAKASSTKEDEENAALEEFLSGFSFDDEIVEEEPNAGYDEEFYEKTVNNSKLSFSKDDISCIKKLLESEINDDTMRNIEQYAVSCPIKKAPNKKEILEELVTNYTISQNVSFTQDDVNALYKLISVELDNDFITDLRTNPQKTQEMEKDILAYGDKPKKPSEIITLSVKDMLPDLSDALKKQGNKKIESNRRAETIYFSEGYEVSKLTLSEGLPDLSKEINKKDAYVSKPSAAYEYVDTSYVVGNSELKISSDLPDLQDVLAHPEKYEKKEEPEVVVDAEALLNNISNVQFKPFYDGTNEFEVLNDFSDVPTVSEVQDELNQFGGIEVAEEEHIEKPALEEEYDDFKALYSNEYVDLDKEDVVESAVNEDPQPANETRRSLRSQSAEELMRKIEATKLERERRRARIVQKEEIAQIEDSAKQEIASKNVKCVIGGEAYSVISTAAFDSNKGCHLAKNENGYAILGYIGSRVVLINNYESFKSEKIHARLSEQLSDGVSRYLIRVGVQKLVVNVKDDNIEFVMDLC